MPLGICHPGDKMGPGDGGISSGHSSLHQLSRGRIWHISHLTESPLCPVAALCPEKPKQLAFLGDTLEKSSLSDGEKAATCTAKSLEPPPRPGGHCWQCHMGNVPCRALGMCPSPPNLTPGHHKQKQLPAPFPRGKNHLRGGNP